MQRLKAFILFGVLFLIFLFPTIDADLGWHLKYGEYFWQTGKILFTNTFSTTLPQYAWVNHSWGYDLVVALLYRWTGFVGMSFLAATLIAGSIYLPLSRNLKYKPVWFLGLLVFGYFTAPLLATGIKSQLVSLFLTSLVWWCLQEYRVTFKKHYLYLLPLIFFLWANLHGQFILGLGLVGLYALGQKDKKTILRTGLASLLVTLINPFGYRLHTDISGYFLSPVLSLVQEWQPWGLTTPKMLGFFLYTACLWWFIYRKKTVSRSEILGLLFLNFMAIKSRRMIPLFLTISLAYFMEMVYFWAQQLKVKTGQLAMFNRVGFALMLLYGASVLDSRGTLKQNWETYCSSEISCSEGLITFLKDNQIRGKIFNAYRLGGHLIYRYPEEKVFIDARMTMWQDGEGEFPMKEYTTMVYTKAGSRELFMGHNFDYVLINREYPLTQVLAKTEKWPVIFEDSRVVVFKNPGK